LTISALHITENLRNRAKILIDHKIESAVESQKPDSTKKDGFS
jgi:hypothetical protein